MKRKIEIILDMQDNKGNLSFLFNGKVITALFGYNLKFNARTNELKFTGQRLSTDEYGQYFVNEQGETATDEVDLLKYFSDEGTVAEYISNAKKSVEFRLKNLRDTSLFNARRMIRERLG
jgi:hypothetical protein